MLARIREVANCLRETAQWLSLTLAYLGVRPLKYPYELQLRTRQQITLHERTDLIVLWLVFMRQHYPVKSSDKTIVDVGANIGMFTLYAARQASHSHIVAIEPFPETYDRLRLSVERNGLQGRVTVLKCALASTSGLGNMDIGRVPSQYRRLYSEATKSLNMIHRNMVQQTPNGVEVKTGTLDQALQMAKVGDCDLMKLNVHGSEYEILMSTPASVLKRCKRIAVQYHEMPAESNLGKGPLFRHLEHLGFRLVSDQDTRRGAGLAIFAL